MLALVGGYTTPDRNGRGRGIAAFRIPGPGQPWEELRTDEVGDNPSMLRFGPGGRVLYVAHGGRDWVSAFAVDPASGRLDALGRAESGGNNPVDLAVDRAGRALMVANYGGGTVGRLALDDDGRFAAAPPQVTALQGTPGPNVAEQGASHPHGIHIDPDGRLLAVPDKGLDRVFLFRLGGRLLDPPAAAATQPGAGPRHAVFHPALSTLYVVNELNASIEAFRLDRASGTLDPAQIIPTLPPGTSGWNACAEIVVTPDGRFVHASNRGHDSIASYAVGADGRLRFLGCAPVGGNGPRFFALDPAGTGFYVANQDSDTVVFLPRDAAGLPGAPQLVARVGSPSTIVFAGSAAARSTAPSG